MMKVAVKPLPTAAPKPKKKAPAPAPVSKYNGTLSANGYGVLSVRLLAVTFGTKISSTTSSARTARTLYTNSQSSYSFGIAVICPTWAEYVRLGEWIQEYGHRVLTSTVGLMRVRLPSRGFDRVGIPSGASFGADVGEQPRTMSIGFIGAADLVDLSTEDVTRLSNFLPDEWKQISQKDKATPYFYPAGQQLSGLGQGDDLLYNSTTGSSDGSTNLDLTPERVRAGGL